MSDSQRPPSRLQAQRRHWRSVLVLTVTLLTIWFIAGPVLGILLADRLNTVMLGGFPLGFWFAQQGSIIIFLLLIAIYAVAMNRLDRRYRREVGLLGTSASAGEDL